MHDVFDVQPLAMLTSRAHLSTIFVPSFSNDPHPSIAPQIPGHFTRDRDECRTDGTIFQYPYVSAAAATTCRPRDIKTLAIVHNIKPFGVQGFRRLMSTL